MVRSITGLFAAFAILASVAIGAASAEEVVTGIVKQVDPRAGVILLDDGRRVLITNGTQVLSNERPVELVALAPGSSVVVITPGAASASPRLSPYRDEPKAFGSPSLQAP